MILLPGIGMSRVRYALQWRWRKLTGRSGEFQTPERSSRAEALSERWRQKYPEVEPIGYLLRDALPERWVRFHSLPDSKRYADTVAENAEVLRRHRIVLGELQGGLHPEDLIAMAQDYDARDLASGWSRNALERPWPWRKVAATDEDLTLSYLWVKAGMSDNELNALLKAAADDQASVILSTKELDWLYHPYDGGADVIASDTETRGKLRDRHAEWLSAHTSGL